MFLSIRCRNEGTEKPCNFFQDSRELGTGLRFTFMLPISSLASPSCCDLQRHSQMSSFPSSSLPLTHREPHYLIGQGLQNASCTKYIIFPVFKMQSLIFPFLTSSAFICEQQGPILCWHCSPFCQNVLFVPQPAHNSSSHSQPSKDDSIYFKLTRPCRREQTF